MAKKDVDTAIDMLRAKIGAKTIAIKVEAGVLVAEVAGVVPAVKSVGGWRVRLQGV